MYPFRHRLASEFTLIFVPILLLGSSQKRLKSYFSPDKAITATIMTISPGKNQTGESNVEFRTSSRRLIGAKSFLSKDQAHGLGVLQAMWSFDSNYFVFSTVSSGGRRAGQFPTFYFNRTTSKIYMLDGMLRAPVVAPDFSLQAPDMLIISVRDSTAYGGVATRKLRLSEFPR